MILQYLPQTNETCYSVLQEFEMLKSLNFSQLNKSNSSKGLHMGLYFKTWRFEAKIQLQ
jgi:hypothetical protein